MVIPEADLKKMLVKDLKLESLRRGLPTKKDNGANMLKGDLVQSLRAGMATAQLREITTTSTSSHLHPDAHWQLLSRCEVPVNKDIIISNESPEIRNPTLPVGEVEPDRYDIDWTGSVPPFTSPEPPGPRAQWLNANKLDASSAPIEWMEALFDPSMYKEWTINTNLKASIMGFGTRNVYPHFTPFSPVEIRRFIGLYMLQGLCPSAQISQKFYNQKRDPIGGSDLCCRVFGGRPTVSERRLREFKRALAVQDPRAPPPPAREEPTYKVDPLLTALRKASQEAFTPGRNLAGDEQTCGFQGRSQFKLRITYKAEGDGFQCDAICDSGYTYDFHFRQSPAPAKWLKRGFSPLHSRVLGMLEKLPGTWHNVTFDNFYTSVKFIKAAYKLQVLAAGVARKGKRGIPKDIIQEHHTNPAKAAAVRGTVKAAAAVDDPDVANLVAVSCYDQKPVYYISTAATSIKWIVKDRLVYRREVHRMVSGHFLRLNLLDEYNYFMGSVDIADQLRGSYRMDKNMRKWKWW